MPFDPPTLLISPFFDASTPSGGVLYSVDVTREWLRRGRAVCVLCSTRPRSLQDLQGAADAGSLSVEPLVEEEATRFTHMPCENLYARTRALIDRFKPDIVHVHNIHGCLSAVEAALDGGTPVILTALDFGLLCPSFYLHDGTPVPCEGPLSLERCARCVMRDTRGAGRWLGLRMPQGLARRLWPRFARLHQSLQMPRLQALLHKVRTHLDAVVAPSPVMAERLKAFGVREERIFEILYGVSPEKRVRPQKTMSERLRFAFLGSAEPIKGLAVLAAAIEHLPENLPLEIRAIGGERVAAEIGRYPARTRRYLKTKAPLFGRELAEAHADIDAVLVPSLWHENSPFVVLESLANGTPVIASDQAGIRGLISPDRTGWLVRPGHPAAWARALVEAIMQPGRIRRMQSEAHFGRTTAEHLNDIEQIEVPLSGIRDRARPAAR